MMKSKRFWLGKFMRSTFSQRVKNQSLHQIFINAASAEIALNDLIYDLEIKLINENTDRN